jgi:hypothetical protein
MALKITTQLSTDSGLTSEAYVRIVNYSLNKNGSAEFRLQLFKSQEDAATFSARSISAETHELCRNKEIGEILHVFFLKEVDETVITTQEAPVAIDSNTKDETIIKTIKKTVPDFSKLVGVDIFTVGYNALKTKLVELYGQQNVVNC